MLNISFDFDETTHKVTNFEVVSSDGKSVRAKRKKTGISLNPVLEVDENKLILNDKLCEMLDADAGDRISINYESINNQVTFPLIAKSEMFADKQSGNKLTKANTVSFRGTQKDVLLEYGSLFTIEKYKDVFKLIRIDSPDEIISASDEIINELENEAEMLAEVSTGEIDVEMEKIINEQIDDLPF